VARFQYLLAGTLWVHHDHLEEVLELHIEEFDQPVPEFWTRPASARLII
jgi:hypothetical protein